MTIRRAYLFTNGMVMAYDAKGQQIAELQGVAGEVRPKLEEATAAPSEAQFFLARWDGGDGPPRVEVERARFLEVLALDDAARTAALDVALAQPAPAPASS